ncbi:MAG: right-handed parallel beta-helix repeat-containing protein [Aeromicrobium sp.]
MRTTHKHSSHRPTKVRTARLLAIVGVVLALVAGTSAALASVGDGTQQEASHGGAGWGRCPGVVDPRDWWLKPAGKIRSPHAWRYCWGRPGDPTAPTPSPTTPTDPEPTTSEPTTPEPTVPEPTTPSPSPTTGGCADDPSSCGYPDASNTGVPAGVELTKSGSIDASEDGQVIDGLDVTGEINVTAKNVTIRNTRVTGGRGAGAADWVVILRPGADNLTIEDSEIRTPEGSDQDIACIFNIGDSRPTITRVDIHACSAGVSSGGGLVEDSYIHDMASVPGLSHVVGVASNGGGGMTVRHNTIFNQYDQTAAIAFYQDFGTQKDNLVEDNLLAGGGYCVYGGAGQSGATSNIRFVDNRFSRKYSPDCGFFGVVASFTLSDPGNAWTGNYWDDTLKPLER